MIEPHTAKAAVAENSLDDPKIANAVSLIAFIAVTPFSLPAPDFARLIVREMWERFRLAPVTAITKQQKNWN